MSYDLIIMNGRIVDGSGRAARGGNVAVQDGRIAAVGEAEGPARRTIDAAGLVVAPGFVDPHTHYDAQLAWDPYATPSCFHGVTTVLIGNCGFTLAPCRPEGREYLTGLFSTAEQVAKETLYAGVPFAWETYPEFLGWLDGRGLGVNAFTQIGHSAVRAHVMGEAALERTASEDEIARMVALVEEALAAGAAGFSTSQVAHQVDEFGRHTPSYFAADEETLALAATVKRRGRGFVCLNPRTKALDMNQRDRDFMVKLAEVSGGIVSWNDFSAKPKYPGLWRELLDYMEASQAQGRPVYAVARSNPADSRFDFIRLPIPFNQIAVLVDFYRLEAEEKLAVLADAARREPVRCAFAAHPRLAEVRVEQGATAETQAYSGRGLADIARERGAEPADMLLALALADRLATTFSLSGFSGADAAATEAILKSPATLVGISDGGAHLHTFPGGDYTSHFLADWTRERGAFTLEAAVHELTARPAQVFGLSDRGRLAPGLAADIVLFDPETVAPLAVERVADLPSGGTRIVRRARGIPWVLVNGTPIVEDGALTGERPGRLLRFATA
jgi:N-acyl-D-aspartate/D-glutamate deacylase